MRINLTKLLQSTMVLLPWLITPQISTGETIQLDERLTSELAAKNEVTKNQLNAINSQAELMQAQYNEQYGYELQTSLGHSRSNKPAFTPYAPVVSPNNYWDIRVRNYS